MTFLPLKSFLGLFAGAAVFALFPSGASAQYMPRAPQNAPQPRANTVSSAQVLAPATTYVPPPAYPAYAPGYGPVEYKGPYGGYLSGAADVINARGNLLVTERQGDLVHEQVKQAKIDTRRKTFDNYLYEREMTPTPEEERERRRLQEVERSRNNPPLTEIWSGKALNDLLVNLQKLVGIPGPTIPLSPELLRHVSVTSGQGHSGLGLLKDGGQVQWPVTLQVKSYEAECRQIEQLLPQAVKQAETGSVSANIITAITAAIDVLLGKLKQNVASISANDYIKAKRYLNELAESTKVLQDPNTANYITGRWSAKGDTVGELVFNMSRQGLQFAPATAGDQEAYTALHRAMVAYDTGLGRMASR